MDKSRKERKKLWNKEINYKKNVFIVIKTIVYSVILGKSGWWQRFISKWFVLVIHLFLLCNLVLGVYYDSILLYTICK